jgi:hypothetical protein
MIFPSVTSGPVKIFLSDRSTVSKEDPRMSDLASGGGNIMLTEVDGVDTLHTRIAPLVKVVMSLRTQWFGVREFAIQDPDGYVILSQRESRNRQEKFKDGKRKRGSGEYGSPQLLKNRCRSGPR